MNMTPKSMRLQVALMGRVNVGKSSFLNLVCGQNVAVTSGEPGTTTDVVEKNQELLPIGPITWLDTPGLGDTTILADKRLAKTRQIFERADVIILLLNGDTLHSEEQQVIDEAEKRKIPLIKIYTKADEYTIATNAMKVNSLDASSRDRVLNELKSKLLEICPEEFIKTPKETVAKYLGKSKVLSMARFQVGEGMEKREENFAEEVAAQMRG